MVTRWDWSGREAPGSGLVAHNLPAWICVRQSAGTGLVKQNLPAGVNRGMLHDTIHIILHDMMRHHTTSQYMT